MRRRWKEYGAPPMSSLITQPLISERQSQAWSVAARDSTAKGESWQMDFFFLDPQLTSCNSFQDAAAQCCPVGLPGLQFNDDWRSWKAEEGDIFEEGKEECCKVGTGGEELPGGRQACLPQGYQDKILKHTGSVSCLLQR